MSESMRLASVRPVNNVADIAGFLRDWDRGRSAGSSSPPRQQRSDHGHINLTGDPDDPSAADLVPGDEQFWSEIETGVRPLVYTVVTLGFVTYSSCEGHRVGAAFGVPKRHRHVGILPRDPGELGLLRRSCAAAALAYRAFAPASWGIGLVVAQAPLTDDLGNDATVVDIDLVPGEGVTDETYFAHLDAAATLAAGALLGAFADTK